MNCKQCREEMNPVQSILSSTHGICGKCTRKNHRLVLLGKDIEEKYYIDKEGRVLL